MLIEHNREKLINAIIYFSKKTKYCGKTKLFKLLYFLDFMHFRETGKSVTGLTYNAWNYGPVSVQLYEEINSPPDDLSESLSMQPQNDRSFFKIQPKKKFDNKHFSKREIRILEEVSYIFKDAKANDITDESHLPNHPWDKTIKSKGARAEIDYMLALDNSGKSLLPDEVNERTMDKKNIVTAFNTKRNHSLS